MFEFRAPKKVPGQIVFGDYRITDGKWVSLDGGALVCLLIQSLRQLLIKTVLNDKSLPSINGIELLFQLRLHLKIWVDIERFVKILPPSSGATQGDVFRRSWIEFCKWVVNSFQ